MAWMLRKKKEEREKKQQLRGCFESPNDLYLSVLLEVMSHTLCVGRWRPGPAVVLQVKRGLLYHDWIKVNSQEASLSGYHKLFRDIKMCSVA